MIADRFFSSFEGADPVPALGTVGTGPARSYTARPLAGFTGAHALHCDGSRTGRLFDVDVSTGEHTELSYVVFPEPGAPELNAEFADGATLPAYDGPPPLEGQWNLVRRPLPPGRTVRAITLGGGAGWVDDVRIADRPPRPRDAVEYVRTTRGSHSSGEYSRGNTFPATAVPHGFNFWTPVTDASSTTWLYEYHRSGDEQNRPKLEGFALSHQPSPWMGDRHSFVVVPEGDLTFSHDDEIDLPHHYGVRCTGGLRVDVAPADHAAILRFTGTQAINFQCRRGRIKVKNGVVKGHTSVRSRLSAGARRMFVYGTLDEREHTIELRVATSLISLKQARYNLDAEIPAGTTFEQVRDDARAAWQELLGRVTLDGATEDQLTTFYSGLYRLFLYPNSGHEETNDGRRHASPVAHVRKPKTFWRTEGKVFDGPMSVNNGFWDTYRTCWPAYALFTPARCGELIDGFVRQYREGGWIARWSSPGYADLMTGTSSDVAFADAYLKGVKNFDVEGAYEAALKNATVAPPRQHVGRKGLHESIFLGYTPLTTPEGMSWALEACVNDFGLANFAEALGRTDDAKYFRQRALHYVHHFDERIGFFQGRHRNGAWRCSPERYDPADWGHDYTETDGWNMAFSVPHDGRGLANLHGGRAALESKLDTFFATPETGQRPGSYGGIIHEMREARDVGLGQYGHSNQPSHHIPFMYLHAGAPAKSQRVVRQVLDRLYTGSEIGQGYHGDEDNGEMSAWYVFASLGLYPLAVGSPGYVLGTPLFPRAEIALENGNRVLVEASGTGPYVKSLRVNGKPHEQTWITHDALVAGAHLEFELSETPGDWGTPPPSLTGDDARPEPLTDLTGRPRRRSLAALFDDTSATQIVFDTATPVVEFEVDGEPRPVEIYTLTTGTRGAPTAWVFEGSDDGREWEVLDERSGEEFRWERQTRPFALARPAERRYYRLRITASTEAKLALAQWELLAARPAGAR